MSTHDADAVATRLDEAARTWTTHLGTARDQMRDATHQLLAGFTQILGELDAISAPAGGASVDSACLDHRADVLAHCETRLRSLCEGFRGFVESRDEMLAAVDGMAGESGQLDNMAEEVAQLARHTNLLSINAAIEAARAGQHGRGFAIVAAEVRRLSAESGDTGRRIGEHAKGFGARMASALERATVTRDRDAHAIHDSEKTIQEVVAQVDGAVTALNDRAAELATRANTVRRQVEQMLIAFQFQDRVQQILDQVVTSITQASIRLRESLSSGHPPEAADWQALLSSGYTTSEQRSVQDAAPADGPAATETTFF